MYAISDELEFAYLKPNLFEAALDARGKATAVVAQRRLSIIPIALQRLFFEIVYERD